MVVLAGSGLSCGHHARKGAISRAELCWRALLDQTAVTEHQQLVTVQDGVDPMEQQW